MEKTYQPKKFESRIYKEWEEEKCFQPHGDRTKPTYLVTMPPPNVTGVLHQGHALFAAIEDTYVRWKRMKGFRTLWVPGTDHAGIATQLMVDRKLEKEGRSRLKEGREKFLEEAWRWTKEHGGVIQNQLRSLGSSCDWSRERFTLDEGSYRSVLESFIRLYHDGLIYRGKRLVNWSAGLNTAVSDLEVEFRSVDGSLYYIKYGLAGSPKDFLTVATTRPETMFADVAVAVHPEDNRYKKFHGRKVVLPLSNREIPVILDEHVDMEFGTGALKITPGHDHNDWEIGKRHNLEILSTISYDGTLTDLAGSLKGLSVLEGRKETVKKLGGFLLKQEPHQHDVGHCQRSGVIVEPLVSTQWFVKMKPLAQEALLAARGEDGKEPSLRFFPEFWRKTYFGWLDNIQDWCISRQLWWGHQIPAWYCEDCDFITVPASIKDPDPSKCGGCASTAIERDKDVLDTWYSSGLWPITTLGWPDEEAKDLVDFYPQAHLSHVRKQGHQVQALMETGSDILFFWVARMLMMCLYFMKGRLPFEDIYLHAMVRDDKGEKMSKTKGNVIDPMDIIEEHGADALRITLLVLSGGGKSVNFNKKRLEGYRGFLNKLWNASRFSLPFMEKENASYFEIPWTKEEIKGLTMEAHWILISLNKVVGQVDHHLSSYRVDQAFQSIYQFTWYEFCDWYLELSKLQDLKDKTNQKVLHYVLSSIVKLLHPMAPFITEEIYSYLPHSLEMNGLKKKRLILESSPQTIDTALGLSDQEAHSMEELKKIVEGIRSFRTENKISPKTAISVLLQTSREKDWDRISQKVCSLAKLSEVHLNKKEPKDGSFSKLSIGEFNFVIPLEGLVDSKAEMGRLGNKIKKMEKDLLFITNRLNNKNFTTRAKPELVEQEKQRKKDVQVQLDSLREALTELS